MKKSNGQEVLPSSSVLEAVLNGMDACLYVTDIQSDEILFINDRMKEHYFLENDPVGSICWKVLQSGFEKRCDFCPIHQLLGDPDTPVVWEEHSTVTGRYYRNIDRIIEWDNGKKVHLQHSTDITDLKLAESALKKRLHQQELMSAISQSFTSMQDTRILIHESLKMAGEFMGVNQAFLSEYHQEEGLLECLYEWCDQDGRPFIGSESKWQIDPEMEIYKNLTEEGFAAVSDYTLLTHPNFETVKKYDLRAFLNFPIEVSGRFWGILGFIINKRTYDWDESDIHLGKLIAGIFAGVIRRNMTEVELVDAKDTAERASRAKGEFLSNMSHEIRTPMNAIIGMTNIAQNTRDLQKMEYYLGKIDSASKHLLGLINDILDISKIEENKLVLSPIEFDFERMLMNITSVLNFRIEEKTQNLIVNIHRDIPTVFIGDEMRLSQVIANLLSNAVKFTPEKGTIVLNVFQVDVSDDTATLLFEIIDNGIGISEEQQARLFKPFTQADGGIARKYGGTGLGLTISSRIVQLMEGKIWIESELGHGAKFSFTSKLKNAKNPPQLELHSAIDKDNIGILIVEGIPEIRDYLMCMMSELGLSYDIADNGFEALELITKREDNPYHMVFLDWIVSDFNSISLIKKIRRMAAESTIAVIISSTDWSNVEKDAIEAGVNRFVLKPLFPSTIIASINESFGEKLEVKSFQENTIVHDFEGFNLLVAEDIDINREILLAVLENTKISIDFAEDGIEVVSMFEQNMDKYNLILMDIQMPEMDGYEATRKIRALDAEKGKNIPIIAMTANVFREDVDRCVESGMNGHIGKPVNVDELLAKLNNYCPIT